MAFDNDAVLPLEAKAERITPTWQVTRAQVGGGGTVRNSWWSDPLHRIEVDFGIITLASYESFKKHFNGRRAGTRGWPYLSRSKFQATAEAVGTGDGSTAAFQLKIADGDSFNAYTREIYKVVALSETVFVDAAQKTRGTHYNIDNNTGIITFTGGNIPTGGQIITWSGQFYIPVTYLSESIDDMELFMWVSGGTQLVSLNGVQLMECRDIT